MASGSVDINKPGKYPIVLSDALLGKASSETYTGIRYNHKPDSPAGSSPIPIHLQPNESDPTSYDLSLTERSDKYTYQGGRTSGDGQYVLIFDPLKKHFVLHRIDSTFDMNLVKAPWAPSSTLRAQYPQIGPDAKPQAPVPPPPRRITKTTKKTPTAKAETVRRKAEPKPKKSKPPPVREPTPEEEDSDDGLTVEYPDGPSSSQPIPTYSTPIFRRDPSEEASDEDEDADHEEYEEERNQDVDHLKLPSPANNNAGGMGMSDEDELDLEAELEQALQEGSNEGGNESDESEEE